MRWLSPLFLLIFSFTVSPFNSFLTSLSLLYSVLFLYVLHLWPSTHHLDPPTIVFFPTSGLSPGSPPGIRSGDFSRLVSHVLTNVGDIHSGLSKQWPTDIKIHDQILSSPGWDVDLFSLCLSIWNTFCCCPRVNTFPFFFTQVFF